MDGVDGLDLVQVDAATLLLPVGLTVVGEVQRGRVERVQERENKPTLLPALHGDKDGR